MIDFALANFVGWQEVKKQTNFHDKDETRMTATIKKITSNSKRG